MAAKTRQRRVSDQPRRRPHKKLVASGKSGVQKQSVKKQAVKKPAVKKTAVRAARLDIVQLTLATFAHEVRTPLTGILALSDLLAASDLGDQERRWVDTIKTSAQHLASLATLFVDAAKTVRGLAERLEVFDLRALVRAAGDSLAGRAAIKGLQARVEIADSLPAWVEGDPVRVRAALENLIDNAVKFTAHGGVELLAEPCSLPPSRPGKAGSRRTDRIGVAFVISDSGIGVSMADIKRLFRPFTQAGVSIAARFGGAGLGLSSVKQLALAMGGDITVTPRPEGGVSFRLTLQLKPAPCDAVPALQRGQTADPASPLVLSVADNPFGRVVLNTILSELGCQAEFVGRGEDAVERLQRGGVDVVLMDLMAPGIDALEAVRRLRKAAPPQGRIAIIAISSRGEDEVPAREAGADAFLLKPVSLQDLAGALGAAPRDGEV